MDFLRNLMDQMKTIWRDAAIPVRAGFVAVALLLVSAVVAVGIWSSQPEYVPLANGLSPTEAAELVSKLDTEGIDHKLNYSGSGVLVPRTSWNRARIAGGDLVGSIAVDQADLQESLLSDPTLNHFRILRNREELLSQTIGRMQDVQSATVHIGRADPSPFLNDADTTTASVVLELNRGSRFTSEQVAAVVSLVANSMEGLAPDDVSVLNTRGDLLTERLSGAQSELDRQYEFRRKLETDLAAKAESMLAEMLGPGHAIVRVSAELDFTQETQTETTYDPDAKVKLTESIETTTTKDIPQPQNGAAGIAANVGNAPTANDTGSIVSNTEKIDATYENAKVEKMTQEATGTIQRLSVAATVDLPDGAGGDASEGISEDDVQQIISQAVGLSLTRGDAIKVLVAPLTGSPFATNPVPVPATDWTRWIELLRSASLGLASITALLVGYFVCKRMLPVTTRKEEHESVTANPQKLGELILEVREHPELVAQILATWLDEEVIPVDESEVASIAMPTDTAEQSADQQQRVA